jgi:signal transduction histidine kinase
MPAGKGDTVQLVVEISESLLMVNVDRSRMYEVISNLLSNAIKFTEEGQIVVRVEKKEQVDGRQYALVTVKDTGAGIHQDLLPRLFTRLPASQSTGPASGSSFQKA